VRHRSAPTDRDAGGTPNGHRAGLWPESPAPETITPHATFAATGHACTPLRSAVGLVPRA
jgi:hypothetical protein